MKGRHLMHSLWVVMSKIILKHLRDKIHRKLQQFLLYFILYFDYLLDFFLIWLAFFLTGEIIQLIDKKKKTIYISTFTFKKEIRSGIIFLYFLVCLVKLSMYIYSYLYFQF